MRLFIYFICNFLKYSINKFTIKYIIFVQIKNYFIIIIILTADDKRNETAIDTSDIRINLNNTKLPISTVVIY